MSDQLKRVMESGSESDMDAYLEIHSAAEIIRDIRNITGKNDDLRDHFAGLAMQSMMDHYSRNDGLVACDFTEMAKESYLMADAMLAARKGGSDD